MKEPVIELVGPGENNIFEIMEVLGTQDGDPIYVFSGLDDGFVVVSNVPLNEKQVYAYLESR